MVESGSGDGGSWCGGPDFLPFSLSSLSPCPQPNWSYGHCKPRICLHVPLECPGRRKQSLEHCLPIQQNLSLGSGASLPSF